MDCRSGPLIAPVIGGTQIHPFVGMGMNYDKMKALMEASSEESVVGRKTKVKEFAEPDSSPDWKYLGYVAKNGWRPRGGSSHEEANDISVVSDFTPTLSIYGVAGGAGCTVAGALISAISPENPDEAIKTLLAVIVEHAGGDFVGVQDALPEHGLPAYVLFNHPKHRSTLALPLNQNFGTEAIRNRLAECNRKYSRRDEERGTSDAKQIQ